MKTKEKKSIIETTVIGSEDNAKTFEIIKELINDEDVKEEVILIQVFPTISLDEGTMSDVTTFHLVNRMKELGWKKVHMLNLFSSVSKERLKAKDLLCVDTDNMLYIKERIKTLGKDVQMYIGWGNSLSSNQVAIQSKIKVLEEFQNLYPKGKLYQLTCDALEEETDSVGTHILFLGLRYSKERWYATEYPFKMELEHMKKQVKQEKTTKKREVKNSVSQNNEQT